MNSPSMPPTKDAVPLLQVVDLHKSYAFDSQRIHVLKGINFTLQEGELVAMIGASGAGKSTFLHIIGTLDRPTQGSVFFKGKNLFQQSETALAGFRNRKIGFVFQFHHLLPEFTALENTYLPALIQKCSQEEAIRQATTLLTEVGLGHRLHHKPGELSGGEQQRVAVARALVRQPDLILADEPTGNLDTQTGDTLFALLRDLNRKRRTAFVIVTHNERLSQQADRIVHMTDGQITDQSPTPFISPPS